VGPIDLSPGNPETNPLFDAPFDRTAEVSVKIIAVKELQTIEKL
jgi:hypothetical protein